MSASIHRPQINMRFVVMTSLLAVLLVAGAFTATAFLGPAISNAKVLPAISFEEAQKEIPFAIPQPKWLPNGLVLQAAHVSPPSWVQYFYSQTNGGKGGLGIEVTQGATQSQYIFPETTKQAVLVNGQSAFCVKGAWNEKQEWISTADAGHLEWSVNGFLYSIGHSGLGLACNDLIKIAESLQQ